MRQAWLKNTLQAVIDAADRVSNKAVFDDNAGDWADVEGNPDGTFLRRWVPSTTRGDVFKLNADETNALGSAENSLQATIDAADRVSNRAVFDDDAGDAVVDDDDSASANDPPSPPSPRPSPPSSPSAADSKLYRPPPKLGA